MLYTYISILWIWDLQIWEQRNYPMGIFHSDTFRGGRSMYEFSDDTQLERIQNQQCFFIANMDDTYPCVWVISAASMFIICLLVASFRVLVIEYSCMMCSTPGFAVKMFSVFLSFRLSFSVQKIRMNNDQKDVIKQYYDDLISLFSGQYVC